MADVKAPVAAPKPRGRVKGAAVKPFKEALGDKVQKVYDSILLIESAAKKRTAVPLDPEALESAKETLVNAIEKAFEALGKIRPKVEGATATTKKQTTFRF